MQDNEDNDLNLENIIDEKEIEKKVEETEQKEEISQDKDRLVSNAVLEKEYTIPYNANSSKDVKVKYRISLPSIPFSQFTENLKQLDNLELDDKDPATLNWKNTVQESIDNYTPNKMYEDRFYDKDSQFRQGLADEQNELYSISPVKMKDKVGDIKGEIALLKIAKHLNLGELVRIPLYHSGLWVTVKPPSEADLVDFFYNIFRDKLVLGRETSGYTLSNYSVFFNNALVDFIISHVHSLNVADMPIEDLKKYMSIHDLNALAWGFASSYYPDGFEFSRACMNTEFCSHVAIEKLNINKLLWVDNSSLSPYQKQYMIDYRANKKTMEEYNKYNAEHIRLKNSYFKTPTDIKFNLKNPSFDDYVTNGLRWVNSITSIVESQVINIDDEDKQEKKRIELINQHIKTSILQQYNHFVDSIEIEDSIITDPETIRKSLNLFSSDEDIRTQFFEQVNKFIEKNTLAIVGIPTYTCPSCGYKNEEKNMPVNFQDVIPLDVINIFFVLLTQRVSIVMAR